MIVVAVASPGTRRHIADFHELPVSHVSRCQPQIIANRRRDVQTVPMVKIRLRPLIPEDILKMIGAEWPAIFPLGVANAIAFTNGDPTMTAHRLPLAGVGLLKPRDHQRRFWLELAMR